MHAHRFVHQVKAREPGKCGGDALFIAGLDVRHLGIAHAGGRAHAEVVVLAPIWAQPAVNNACSPLPPDIAPVRRSETNGHGPMMAGAPGTIEFT